MDWRDYFTGGKKYDPAPEKPSGLPNIEKVPPMPPCKPPKSDFVQIGNLLIIPGRVDGICLSRANRRIDVTLKNGESWESNCDTEAEFDSMLSQISKIFNIEIKEP